MTSKMVTDVSRHRHGVIGATLCFAATAGAVFVYAMIGCGIPSAFWGVLIASAVLFPFTLIVAGIGYAAGSTLHKFAIIPLAVVLALEGIATILAAIFTAAPFAPFSIGSFSLNFCPFSLPAI